MPNTFTKLYFHVVFSTKNRVSFIHDEISERLYPYMNGIARNIGYELILANGTKDHTHMLIKSPPRLSLSEIIRSTKSNSSKWIHETFHSSKNFSWQKGFSAFTVSQSNFKSVYRYIQNQRKHHPKVSFKDELVGLLRRHQINYDEKYLWD